MWLKNNYSKELAVIILSFILLSFEALASNDKSGGLQKDREERVSMNDVQQTVVSEPRVDIPFLRVNGRQPTDDEMAVMLLMLTDSINYYWNHYVAKNISDAEVNDILRWKSDNKEILDKWLIGDARMVWLLSRRLDHVWNASIFGSPTSCLGHKLLERVEWRRSNIDKKLKNNGFYNQYVDVWIEAFREDFGENSDRQIPVSGIYLGFDGMLFVDMLNLLNGSKFVDCEDWILKKDDLDKIKDWWWANKGNVPEETYLDIMRDLHSEFFLSLEVMDATEFRRFMLQIIESGKFDKYCTNYIVKML